MQTPMFRRSVVLPVVLALVVLAVPVFTLLVAHHRHDRSPEAAVPAASGAAGTNCPRVKKLATGAGVTADWVDFIHAFGKTYVSQRVSQPTSAGPTARTELGGVVLTVRCEIGKLTIDPTNEIDEAFRDGDAAFLPAGTPVYSVNGYKPATRLAAIVDGQVVVYLPDRQREVGPVPGGSR